MGKNKDGAFGKFSAIGLGRKSYHQSNRVSPFSSVQEFEDDKPYMELCWEAEQDARFLLGISSSRTDFTMRAEPVQQADQRVRSPLGSPLRKSYTQSKEIKADSIYSQFKNNPNSFLDNRASFLAYRPSKKDLSGKPFRSDQRLSTAILNSIKPSCKRSKPPVSKTKSDSDTYSYSQDYNTGNLKGDDDIDHLEDLRLSLLSWTTTTHESFVGSAGIQSESRGSPNKTLRRSLSDFTITGQCYSPKRTPERQSDGLSPSVGYNRSSSRSDDGEGTDDEVARITAHGASRTPSTGYPSSQRSRSAQDDEDKIFAESLTDLYDEPHRRLAHIGGLENDGKTFLSRAVRMPMRKYNFMAQA